jgi:hypothetical protein
MTESIVLDLDGVIADIASSIDQWLFRHDDIKSGDLDYSHWLITDSNDDKAMKIFNDPLFWKNLKPYEDAWHQINYWFESGIDVHVVTARRCPAAMKHTEPWLDFWRIGTQRPIFTNIHEKHHVISELNPRFVVEDNPNEVEILLNEGINAFLRKQWYNQKDWDRLPTIDTLYDLDWN